MRPPRPPFSLVAMETAFPIAYIKTEIAATATIIPAIPGFKSSRVKFDRIIITAAKATTPATAAIRTPVPFPSPSCPAFPTASASNPTSTTIPASIPPIFFMSGTSILPNARSITFNTPTSVAIAIVSTNTDAAILIAPLALLPEISRPLETNNISAPTTIAIRAMAKTAVPKSPL